MERRTPRPQPKVDFTIDQLDYRNVTLLRRFVTDHGRILLRKYTGLPAAFQRRLTRSVNREDEPSKEELSEILGSGEGGL